MKPQEQRLCRHHDILLPLFPEANVSGVLLLVVTLKALPRVGMCLFYHFLL